MTSQAKQLRKLAAAILAVADSLPGAESSHVIGRARYNRADGSLTIGRKTEQLSRSEATILSALIDNRGVGVSRNELTSLLFGSESCEISSRTVDNHICNIRQKLGTAATVHTVPGHGYKVAP